MNQTKDNQTTIDFFYEHAGWSQGQGETEHEARTRCARELAHAEEWAKEVGVIFLWEEDPDADRSWMGENGHVDDGREFFGCVAELGDRNTSLWGIDFDNDDLWRAPYRRVVEAELAMELMPDDLLGHLEIDAEAGDELAIRALHDYREEHGL